MSLLRIQVDGETYDRLLEIAVAERRPINFQAEVILRLALGLPFPKPSTVVHLPPSTTPQLLLGSGRAENGADATMQEGVMR